MIKKLINSLQTQINTNTQLSEVLGKGFVAFVFKIGGVLMFFLFNMAVSRYVNTEAWGIFSLFYPVVNIVSVIGIFGCDVAMIRIMAENISSGKPEKAKSLYHQILKLVVGLSLLLSLALFIFSPLLAQFYNNELLLYVFRLGALCILPMAIMSIHGEGLRGMKKIQEFSYLQQGTQFGLALLIFLCFIGIRTPHVNWVIIAFVVAIWITALWGVFLFQKHSGFRSIVAEDATNNHMKHLLQMVFPMFMSGFLFIVMTWTDILILGHYVSKDYVGIYRTGLQIAGVSNMALFAVNTIVAPKFAELYAKNDIEGLAHVVRNSSKLMFVISFPFMLLIFLFPKFILGIFGKDYVIDEALYTVLILTISQLFNVAFGSVLTLLNMTGKQKIVQYIVIVATIINFVLCCIFIPRWGIIGAAIANAVNMLCWNLIASIYIKKHYNFWTIAFL